MKKREEICRAFGKRLKELRLKRKISQKDLAKAAGIHVSFLSDLERGNKACRFDIVVNIAEALDIRVGDLFPDYESYPKEITDFMMWLSERLGISYREILKRFSRTD